MVENKSRGRGRPRTFDETAVLDKAIGVFWQKGFEGASLDDLSSAMGIGRPSVYCAFGDKDSLFKRCLERYFERVCLPPLQVLSESANVKEGVFEYLCAVARSATSDPSHPGCMLGIASMISDQPEIKRYVANGLTEGEAIIASRLQKAVDSGELAPSFDVGRASRRVMDAVLAINARAANGTSLSDLVEDARDVADLIVSR